MGLSTQEQILIEQRVANEARSTGAAYLLWFFLGCLGAHRFYLGRTTSAIAMLALFVVGLLTAAAGIGIILLAVVAIWALLDAFMIPGFIRRHKEEVRQSFATHVAITSGNFAAPYVDTSKWSKKDRERYIAQHAAARREHKP